MFSFRPRGSASSALAAALAKENAIDESVTADLSKSPFAVNPNAASADAGACSGVGMHGVIRSTPCHFKRNSDGSTRADNNLAMAESVTAGHSAQQKSPAQSTTKTSFPRKNSNSSGGASGSTIGNVTRLPMHPREQVHK